ncbi:hypothetical protein HU200_008064 [Digitaria exilis]|uniref:DUF3615 domain-containing protein n=1 Tax=Digitaria exilis TaxID=1010633 RepID=A0A835FMA8_9POAL|nr:hypothetical protein HU200_008064 [Digitaria exilis]
MIFGSTQKLSLHKPRGLQRVSWSTYNKRKKIKFELLDAKPVTSIPEPRCCYTHINFTARSSKEDSQEQAFFAEIYHCRKRWHPNGFIVTCCEPLSPDSAGDHIFFLIN